MAHARFERIGSGALASAPRRREEENLKVLSAKVAAVLAACCLALLLLGAGAAPLARKALWLAVRACVADFKLTESAFPCLQVDLTGGEERGYVVLRSAFGPPDTILAPTRRVTGIEDPWLRSPDAPDYFEAAWRATALLKGADGVPLGVDNHALAVNSALTRSQDQFHIHIGCLAPVFRRWLPDLVAKLPSGQWARLDVAIAGSSFWALRTGRTDLQGVEPVRLAAQRLSGKAQGLARLAILVAQIRGAGADELVILASNAGASGSLGSGSAEDLLDSSCSGEPPASGWK